jgi:TPR repeat protein
MPQKTETTRAGDPAAVPEVPPPAAQLLRAQPTPHRATVQEVLIPSAALPVDETLPPRPAPKVPRWVYAASGAAFVALVALAIFVKVRTAAPDGTVAHLGPVPSPAASPGEVVTVPAPARASRRDSAVLEVAAALPRGARVTVNGVALLARTLSLPPGEYLLALVAPGYAPVSERLRFAPGETVAWSPALVPLRVADARATPRPAPARSRAARTERADARAATSRREQVRATTARESTAAADTPATGAAAPATCAAAARAESWSAALDVCAREARSGTAASAYTLGTMYEQGRGVTRDPAEAVAWYRRAADAGSGDAALRLGAMYERGAGVAKDVGEAVAWYRKGALLGDREAQWKVATAYDRGTGVPKNLGEALSWYRKSAEQGNPRAQNYLGWMYGNGHGVSRDDRQAVAWFRRAAEQGDAQAEYNLGYMYDTGRGVSRDETQAIAWYRKAAAQGYGEAVEQLRQRGITP